jgi:hypothetical protein
MRYNAALPSMARLSLLSGEMLLLVVLVAVAVWAVVTWECAIEKRVSLRQLLVIFTATAIAMGLLIALARRI